MKGITIKLAFAFLLALAPCLVFGQTLTDDTENPTPPPATVLDWPHKPGPEMELAHMTQSLNLSASQKDEIKEILAASAAKRQATLDNADLSQVQKQDLLKDLRQETERKIEGVLTQPQAVRFERMLGHPRL